MRTRACDWGVKADMVLFAGNTVFAWTRYTNRRLLYIGKDTDRKRKKNYLP